MSKHNSLNIGKAITVTINGTKYKSTFGKTILEIARENDIYIPTMCYLTKVQPIASCRMCMVEVKGVEGMILSCQEKAVDGAVVNTDSEALYSERQNIMKLYNVNHPLECGVCDKSGECDLQNKTMEFGLSEQAFTTRDLHRPVQNWGHVSYDPALCIMCEKCVRVSTEITGDEALKVKFGGYGSTIINVKQEKNYASLGEAASVCPVGALVSTDFKYRSNAWELSKVPSACTHCSAGCEMSYEVKGDKIYRVSNSFEFSNLCGAGRYGFDFANENVSKEHEAFSKAVEAVKNANTLIFSSHISNEEALILQKMKETRGTKLVSHEARAYQKFMQAYSSVSGNTLYRGNLEGISKSDVVIVMGTRVESDNPMVKYHINMASKWHRARVAYMHPIEDKEIQNIVTQFIKYEAGSEEGVSALLTQVLLGDCTLPKKVQDFFDDLDIGNLSAETNIGEEELEQLKKSFIKQRRASLIIGADLYAHPKAENIAKILGLVEKYTAFNVVCIPPAGNSMGVSLICDLDDVSEGKTVGYNVDADFVLSATGDGDLDMPAMNQQEGTLTTIDKRVVPMNAALSYGGYVLNDIANALDMPAEYTVAYTSALPSQKGFKEIAFDDLPNYFDPLGEEHRGYILNQANMTEREIVIEEVAELEGFDGAIVYHCDPVEQFSAFTEKSKLLKNEAVLLGSQQFATATKLQDGESIMYTIDGVKFNRVFKIDTSIKGTIALNPIYDMGLSRALLSSYRFSRLDFERVGK